MKQLIQNMRDGKTSVTDVPRPLVRPGAVLVRTARSLVSTGTERMLVEFAEKSLVGKAQARPDLVRQVLDKARREGILPTIEAAFNRLDAPMALGYSACGTVEAVGEHVEDFHSGDRVACAGGGFAVHAEYMVVPTNLVVKLPDNVAFDSAAFTTLGAIALHGFRLAAPQLGSRVAVIGLGLLGLLSINLARAAGCTVFGIDFDPARVELAKKLGAQAVERKQAEAAGAAFTSNQGFDIILICADTKSNDTVELAAALARDRAVVVAVGAVGLELPRKPYYEKELTFLVSRSYGPGRYDPAYEEKGQDYPIGYVRWTEGRNLQAFVDLLAQDKIDLAPLITHHFPIEQADQAYELITGKDKQPFLGILLTYSGVEENEQATRVAVHHTTVAAPTGEPVLGVLGAGNYANAVFLPMIKKAGGCRLHSIASANGLTARHAASKYGFQFAASNDDEILADPDINTVVILTRHNHHARQSLAALKNGKNVFCEKPLAINLEELDEISEVLLNPQQASPILSVGFNRRFAPLAVQMRDFIRRSSEPLFIHYRVNAGFLPLTHWLHDVTQGGGRIIGEGCHFIDFLTYLTGSAPVSVTAMGLPDGGRYRQDNVQLTFQYPDGSVGTVSYLANGDKSFAKERVEVFSGGHAAALDDFRSLETACNGHRQTIRSRFSQNKGHLAGWQAFLDSLRSGGQPPIPYTELVNVTRASILAAKALQTGQVERIPS
jgi:predicted dehydrogenase/threonine dehydrogenase-like Zn-dependent dehydrogenase